MYFARIGKRTIVGLVSLAVLVLSAGSSIAVPFCLVLPDHSARHHDHDHNAVEAAAAVHGHSGIEIHFSHDQDRPRAKCCLTGDNPGPSLFPSRVTLAYSLVPSRGSQENHVTLSPEGLGVRPDIPPPRPRV